MSLDAETSEPLDTQQEIKSPRHRTLTHKAKETREQTVKNRKLAFKRDYDSWKQEAKGCRIALKSACSPDDLIKIKREISTKHHLIQSHYESLLRNQSTTPEIVARMDTCATLTEEIVNLVDKRRETTERYNERFEKERVRIVLNKEQYGSVFGLTNTETIVSEALQESDSSSLLSSSSSKKLDAEAELAATRERAKAMKDIQVQQSQLLKLENEFKLEEARLVADLEQKRLERKSKLEEERTKLEQLKAEKEIQVAAARVRAYENPQNDFREAEVINPEAEHVAPLNPNAPSFQPQSTPLGATAAIDATNLAQALASSLSMSRLPVPELTIFDGDPMKFVDWKTSFMTLIDQKPLPASEKIFYLKTYLTGNAYKAVEGFFYRNSEDAYTGAWKILQERFGDPFVMQKAFRDKLNKWPTINATDPIALREFADFLRGCVEATTHIKGLAILNDCEENHKLLKKLPEWVVRKWSRIVTDELDGSGNYPDLERFSLFLNREARIACNPITSPLLMSMNTEEERLLRRVRTLNTYTQPKNSNREMQAASTDQIRPPCLACKEETHGIARCLTFISKTLEEKRAFIRDGRLCFGCLRKGHVIKNCKWRHTCASCSRRHPTCLHDEGRPRPVEATEADSPPTIIYRGEQVHSAVSHASIQHAPATSSIVPVLVSSVQEPQKEVLTYALLDTQSDSTFILEDLLKHLNVDAQPIMLKLSTMTTTNTISASNSIQGLQIRGLHSVKHLKVRQAYTRGFIPVDKSYIPSRKTASQWPHLKHLTNKMPPLQDCEVGLLIGYDCPSALAPLEVVTGGEDEPFAQRTELGWSIIGSSNPLLDRQKSQSFVHRVTAKEIPTPPITDILKILELDFNERIYEDKQVSQDDVHFIQFLSSNIRQREDGHLEMPLPFKNNNPPKLPNNKRLAVLRLQCLKRKLKTNELYYKHYKTCMEEMISKGDAELASTPMVGETVWYLPHHGVYHPSKPEKLRVVFDCSARFRGISLNDKLLTGPDLINSLVGVLCRFRKGNVAIICDIEKMFHQFPVTQTCRNYLRFLWWKHGELEGEPQEYWMAVHLFGAASSPGCASFGLKHLAREHAVEYPAASAFIQKNFYVDDGLTSVPSVEEAMTLITEAKDLCKRGGLRLHKFNSSHKEVLNCVPPSEQATTLEPLNLMMEVIPAEHALGIQWLIDQDRFTFNINPKDRPLTRRGVLSVVSSLYDPLGFVAPFVLIGKSILQELCRRGLGWDDLLPNDLRAEWEEWRMGLQKLKDIKIPRCYHPQTFSNLVQTELHHFSDASTKGYGVCSYLRYKDDNDMVHCSLVAAKARVAPTKLTSIPRLELTAAVVATNLSVMLRHELNMEIDRELFWTDSQVVLGYINNEARRFNVFVANRVQLIRDNTNISQWHYVDTAENPADHASRGLYATQILSSNWFSGPKFLWEQEIRLKPHPTSELLIGDPEVKTVLVSVTQASKNMDILKRLSRFSSWTKLLKVVARIKRLKPNQRQDGEVVSAQERERAAQVVIELVQQQSFAQELKMLKEGKCLHGSSHLFCLDAILREGVICVGGRLKQSSLGEELKHPVILPRDSHITMLILSHCHKLTYHQGRSQTQMMVRTSGFWAVGGSKLVAKLIRNCVLCRKLRRPTEEQQMAELPAERTEVSAPFTCSGMDCFGPFLIKKGRKEYKRYGLIFTCLSSRAVHVEMLEDLSTDAFINALRCFISIRGTVQQLHCDQGTNFVGARNELKTALKQCDTKSLEAFLSERHCHFVFNSPSASHTGGVWERQIRTIKNVLNATLSQCPGRLDDASLRTLFYEAMSIVNSRPLTVDGLNDPMALEPLTPNHLLMMKTRVALPPPGKFVKEDLYATKRWRRVQYLVEQFWSRWKKEYLINISIRQKWHVPRRNLRVNDIVIVSDDHLPRNRWQLARVVEASPGSDGLVRRVKIKTGTQKMTKGQEHPSKFSVIERPVQRLVLLLERN